MCCALLTPGACRPVLTRVQQHDTAACLVVMLWLLGCVAGGDTGTHHDTKHTRPAAGCKHTLQECGSFCVWRHNRSHCRPFPPPPPTHTAEIDMYRKC